jgi:DNA gyrase subunit A
LTGADVVSEDDFLLLITELGYGKRTPLAEFRVQSRYGKGIRAMNLSDDLTGKLISARVVSVDDEVTCIASSGLILRTTVRNISQQGRYSRGVTVMNLATGDAVASVAVLQDGKFSHAAGEPESLTPAGASANGSGNGAGAPDETAEV